MFHSSLGAILQCTAPAPCIHRFHRAADRCTPTLAHTWQCQSWSPYHGLLAHRVRFWSWAGPTQEPAGAAADRAAAAPAPGQANRSPSARAAKAAKDEARLLAMAGARGCCAQCARCTGTGQTCGSPDPALLLACGHAWRVRRSARPAHRRLKRVAERFCFPAAITAPASAGSQFVQQPAVMHACSSQIQL